MENYQNGETDPVNPPKTSSNDPNDPNDSGESAVQEGDEIVSSDGEEYFKVEQDAQEEYLDNVNINSVPKDQVNDQK